MTAAPIQLFPDGVPPVEEPPNPSEVFPPPTAPLVVARVLLDELNGGGPALLRHWRGSWMRYAGPHWVEEEEGGVRAWLYQRLGSALFEGVGKDGAPELKPWNPTRGKVADVLDALPTDVRVPATLDTPAWLSTGGSAAGTVPCRNGLVDPATREVTPATPDYFGTVALPLEFDPNAAEPTAWLAFLRSVWPDDSETIAMLQEWFGYLVSGRTDLQKAMLLVGPRRSGKGTILRVATALVGAANTGATTLQGLTTQFGLQDAIGKTLLAVGDARLSGSTSALVERLLSIIGEDTLTVDRKYREPWTGRLPGRVMIASNEVPDFRDASGAIGSRFLVAKMVTSFYDREDVELGAKLLAELPGILLWALDGLDRLRSQARFSQSAAAVEARKDMEESESPIAQFLEAACVVGPYTAPRELLYGLWDDWRARNGYAASNIATFGRALRAAEPTIADQRIGPKNGTRVRVYAGLGLRESYTGTGAQFGDDSHVRNPELRPQAVGARITGT